MIDKYYLFSNIIHVDRYHELFPRDLNICCEDDIFSFINRGITDLCKTQSHEVFYRFVYSIFLLVDSLRGNKLYNPFSIYNHFYLSLISLDNNLLKFDCDISSLDFIKSCDFTAIYYNYSVLFGDHGNISSYLHYLSLADNEYAMKNACPEGSFISELIKSSNFALWNIVPSIICDYKNFTTTQYNRGSGKYNQFEETLKAFKIEISKNLFYTLVSDFRYDITLQFLYILKQYLITSNNSNFRELFNSNGQFKNIRSTRFIGELTWLFEVYLKDKLSNRYPDEKFPNPLDNTIKAFLKKIDCRFEARYSQLLDLLFAEFVTKLAVNTEGLQQLLVKVTLKNGDFWEEYLQYLLILQIFRNYYAHYMDRYTNLVVCCN